MKTIPSLSRFQNGLGQALALTVCLIGMNSCSNSMPSGSGNAGGTDLTTVAVTPVEREDLSRTVDITAELLPWQEVEIHARVAGYVKQINVDVGDHAKTGDLLAVLEIPELNDELKQADAAILTAQEEVKSMQAAADASSLVASRLTAAAKETQGLIAQQDIDNATATNQADEANLAAARQKVTEAQAHDDDLRDMIAYSRITAPFDGVVTRRYADVGALVQAGTVQAGTSANSNSMPLLSFEQVNRLRLEFPVPESDVSAVHVGSPVTVTLPSLNQTFPSEVSRFAQKIDMATRTMLTEVDVDNPHGAYTPGMYATVQLTLSTEKGTLAIPIQSLNAGDEPSVLIVDHNKIEKRAVKIGLETPDKVEILDGLSEGDMVVVGNRGSLQTGQAVTPKLADNQTP
jgi:RND family efflux transporter MFP subunit